MNESTAETSTGRSGPPMPAISVARSSRSGPWGSGGSDQVKVMRQEESLFRLVAFGQFQHLVLERQHRPGIDLDRQVELERSAAGLLGMQVDLPRLSHGVGLDEVPFVVDVEPVIGCVVLEIGHEAGHIDDCHYPQDCQH